MRPTPSYRYHQVVCGAASRALVQAEISAFVHVGMDEKPFWTMDDSTAHRRSREVLTT